MTDIRVGRPERDLCVDLLSRAYSEEYLTEEEFTARRDEALRAVSRADLELLTRDLPKTLSIPDFRPDPALIYGDTAQRSCEQLWRRRRRMLAWVTMFFSVAFFPALWAGLHYPHGLGQSNPAIFAPPLLIGTVGLFVSIAYTATTWNDKQ